MRRAEGENCCTDFAFGTKQEPFFCEVTCSFSKEELAQCGGNRHNLRSQEFNWSQEGDCGREGLAFTEHHYLSDLYLSFNLPTAL